LSTYDDHLSIRTAIQEKEKNPLSTYDDHPSISSTIQGREKPPFAPYDDHAAKKRSVIFPVRSSYTKPLFNGRWITIRSCFLQWEWYEKYNNATMDFKVNVTIVNYGTID